MIQVKYGSKTAATYHVIKYNAMSGYWDYLPTSGTGEYIIRIPGHGVQPRFYYGSFFVIPENTLGTLGLALAPLGAASLLFFIRKKRR